MSEAATASSSMLRGLFSDPNGFSDLGEQMGFTSGARIIWIWGKAAKTNYTP